MIKRILLFIGLLFVTIPVYASDVSTSFSGVNSINAGEEFTVTLGINGDNIWGLTANLNYDKSRLTLIFSKGLSGFNATVGTSIVLDTNEGKSGSNSVLELRFKALDLFKPGENTTISISNGKAATDSTKLTVSDCSKKITVNIPKSNNSYLSSLSVDGSVISGFNKNTKSYDLGNTDNTKIKISGILEDSRGSISNTGEFDLKYGKNVFNVVVHAEDGSTSTYSIVINRNDNRSSNNYLASLEVTKARISFNKNTLIYNITVENDIDNININAKAFDSKAVVSGTGNKKLNIYQNSFSIVVTAENGSKRTYKINVLRKDKDGNVGELSSNNNLAELTIKDHEISFDKDTLSYNLTVENEVTKLDITASGEDENSLVEIKNPSLLKEGINEIVITVTAQNGDKKIYTLIVERKDDSKIIPIEEIETIIDKDISKPIIIEVRNDKNEIPKNVITALSKKNILVTINKYDKDRLLYSWKFNSRDLIDNKPFNTLVEFKSNNMDKILNLTDYRDLMYLNYNYSVKLPKNTKFSVYVGNKYKSGDTLRLYYYDDTKDKISLVKDNLVVENGYVSFNLEHASTYLLTKAKLNNNSLGYIIAIVIQSSLIILMLGYYILYIKKGKKISKKKK